MESKVGHVLVRIVLGFLSQGTLPLHSYDKSHECLRTKGCFPSKTVDQFLPIIMYQVPTLVQRLLCTVNSVITRYTIKILYC